MKRYLNVLAAGALLFALPNTAAAQSTQSEPIIQQSFAESEDGWMVFMGTGKVSVTHEPAELRGGKGALKFTYSIAKGEVNLMALPTPGGKIAGMKSLKCWVRADAWTTLAFAIQENGGGRYVAVFSVPAAKWQEVVLSPGDFVLSEDKDAPKDPDGKLDLDQAMGIALIDLAQMAAQAGDNPLLQALFPYQPGPHTLLMSDFTVSGQPVPASVVTSAGRVDIDTFAHPQICWIGVGGARLTRVDGGPLGGPSLKMDYHAGPASGGGVLKPLPRGVLAGTTRLEFDAASAKPTKIFVQVEQPGGVKFNAAADLDGASAKQHVVLAASSFAPAQDSSDPSAKLDFSQVSTILIADVTGVLGGPEQDNTLWIASLKAIK